MRAYAETMARRIAALAAENEPSIYLLGSVVMEDFQPGWSDIDLLCLLQSPLEQAQAEALVGLRQTLVAETGDPVYRAFEGGILTWAELERGTIQSVVYWGTGGERITDAYTLDPFSKLLWKQSGVLLFGPEGRDRIADPTRAELLEAVQKHYQAIRKYGKGGTSLYAGGWMLDTARCLYTLRTGNIIAKTQAGEWALAQGLAPEPEILRRVLEIRRDPRAHRDDPQTKAWMAGLTPHIQAFADVLGDALERAHSIRDF